MNDIEFQTWLSDFGRKFPAVREWYRAIAPTVDRDALLDAWEAAIRDLEIKHCLEVNQLMLSGEIEDPGKGPAQWQYLPARMRRHVETIRLRGEGRPPQSVRDEIEHRRNLIVRDLLKRGLSRAAINVQLRREGLEEIAVREEVPA